MPKIDKEKSKTNLKAYAQKQAAKRNIIQFRVDEINLNELMLYAGKTKQGLGPMVRDWVLERLSLELGRSSSIPHTKKEALTRAKWAMQVAIEAVDLAVEMPRASKAK